MIELIALYWLQRELRVYPRSGGFRNHPVFLAAITWLPAELVGFTVVYFITLRWPLAYGAGLCLAGLAAFSLLYNAARRDLRPAFDRYCSFCGGAKENVGKLIVSHESASSICNTCVELCVQLLADKEEEALRLPPLDKNNPWTPTSDESS